MTGSMQHSLQDVLLAPSQVSIVNWQSIHIMIENSGFARRVSCRYDKGKALFLYKLCQRIESRHQHCYRKSTSKVGTIPVDSQQNLAKIIGKCKRAKLVR